MSESMLYDKQKSKVPSGCGRCLQMLMLLFTGTVEMLFHSIRV